jgi:SAM-dependent methyltransferase
MATATAEKVSVERELRDVARRILDADHESYDPWLHRYCGELADPEDARRYLRWQLDHLALAGVDPSGKAVLDAGCGFGLALVTLGLLGAAKLRGIDNYRGMVETIQAYRPELPGELAAKLEVTYGDVSAMPYDEGEFDLLLSIEAISHYLDVGAFVAEAARVLRPGGVLIVSDGNNQLNPSIRRKTHAIWDAFESAESGTEVHGHQVGSSYRERRRAILDRELPQLAAPDLDELSRLTAGMVENEVIAAGRRFAEDGERPEPRLRRGDVPVSPEGQAMERLFDPFDLAREIEAAGFRAKVHGYWGGANGSRLVRAANALLDKAARATIFTAPSFRIVAVRD